MLGNKTRFSMQNIWSYAWHIIRVTKMAVLIIFTTEFTLCGICKRGVEERERDPHREYMYIYICLWVCMYAFVVWHDFEEDSLERVVLWHSHMDVEMLWEMKLSHILHNYSSVHQIFFCVCGKKTSEFKWTDTMACEIGGTEQFKYILCWLSKQSIHRSSRTDGKGKHAAHTQTGVRFGVYCDGWRWLRTALYCKSAKGHRGIQNA